MKSAKAYKMKFKGDNNLSFVKIDDVISFIELRDAILATATIGPNE